MKNSLKFISIGLVMVVLLMSQWANNEPAAEAVVVSNNTVEFMDTSAATVSYYTPGAVGTSTVKFWINDADLQTTKSASTTWWLDVNHNGTATSSDVDAKSTFSLHTGSTTNAYLTDNSLPQKGLYMAGRHSQVANTHIWGGATWALSSSTGSTYNPSNPASTSLVSLTVTETATGTTATYTRSVSWAKDTVSFQNDFTFGATSTVEATYSYHTVGWYATSTGAKIAKITSTSDSTGEWVAISEVTASGSVTPDDESNFYLGSTTISSDAGALTSGDEKVWVQDGDVLTVTYYGCGGDISGTTNTYCTDSTDSTTVIDTDTAIIDMVKPVITVDATIADATITKDTTPTFTFTVTDASSGFDVSNPGGGTWYGFATSSPHIFVEINDCHVQSSEFSYPSLTSTELKVTVALAPSTSNTFDTASSATNGGLCSLQRDGGGFGIDVTSNATSSGSRFSDTNTAAGTVTTQYAAGTWDGAEFTYRIEAKDKAGNRIQLSGASAQMIVDGTAPDLQSAQTGKLWSSTKDVADNNYIKLTFDESIGQDSVTASDFTVDGVAPESVVFGGTSDTTDRYVYLKMATAVESGSRPVIKIVGAVEDRVGNSLNDKPSGVTTGTDRSTSATDGIADKVTATDGVVPVVSGGAITGNLLANSETATLTFDSTEQMKDPTNAVLASSTAIILSGPTNTATADGAYTPQKIIVTISGDGKVGTATFKEATYNTTGIYGLLANAKDVNSNTGQGGYLKIANEDLSGQITSAVLERVSQTLQIDNWPIVDFNGDGNLATGDFTFTVNGTAATTTITSFDWGESETVTFFFNDTQIAAADTVKVTYYVALPEHTVEIDTAKPTVSSYNPADGTKVTDKTPLIGVTWDEDEYAEDGYQTVTITKAELKDPDGVVTDISGLLTTSNNKSFFYTPSTDLALGEHTITFSAKDDAGNEKTDQKGTFTVVARDNVKITMAVGWNLVSLPGAPADSAINTVITNAEVDSVLTYDPNVAGGWLSAVRDSDGNLAGTLATIDSNRAYWVHQKNADKIAVDIPGLQAGAATTPASIALVKGWNLVPAVDQDGLTLSSNVLGGTVDADTYFSGLTWSRAYWYDTSTSNFASFIAAGSDTLSYGNGYWVYLTKAGDLVP